MKIFILVIMIVSFCIGQTKRTEKENNNNQIVISKLDNNFLLIHEFKMDSIILGKVFVHFVDKEKGVFDTLYIFDSKNGIDTLYSIESCVLKNKGGIDVEVYPIDFWGYKAIVLKNDHMVLYALHKKGKNISDPIYIFWNREEKLFEVMKAP
ncbi:hypothetical protein [Caldithrix abyssi]|uniref:Uncharacterized protein n=1 Tax=Caldithrix abyssi DSM 13497 TaxID=880073 RepID=H1XVX0_CALAY|nr:hypothetical protein [Caldithrix abyssi]APF20824.1 hypothetical protein Cabys_4079 [Caldithrix abyssi DSM 13497]EHO40697.1 hypothetical protein Calab_1067 [Caldithrix abyssi DSM 13497]